MRKPKPFFRVLTESGPLVALAVAIAILVGIAGPASAQFFNFGGGWSRPAPRSNGGGGGWFGGDFFAPPRPRSEWDHETLVERPWDVDNTRRIFAAAEARARILVP